MHDLHRREFRHAVRFERDIARYWRLMRRLSWQLVQAREMDRAIAREIVIHGWVAEVRALPAARARQRALRCRLPGVDACAASHPVPEAEY